MLMLLQKSFPQRADMVWEVEFIQKAFNFLKVQLSDILGSSIQGHLSNIPFTLKWIGKINGICAPDKMSWWLELHSTSPVTALAAAEIRRNIRQLLLWAEGSRQCEKE